jgi:hypothetical protein
VPPRRPADTRTVQTIRTIALAKPGVEEGVSCKGTSLERRTFTVSGKAFLFYGAPGARLKLSASLPEARELAAKEPERFQAGAGGWVKVSLEARAPSKSLLSRWIDESYRLMAAPAPGGATPGKGKAAKKAPRR